LAVAVWKETLDWCREHPDKSPPMFSNPEISQLIKRLEKHTNQKVRCEDICSRKFESAENHSNYIEKGGCNELMEVLVGK
jgi:hypothetical protein